MLHAIIQTYADAVYVATTLRPPKGTRSNRPSEDLADDEARSQARSSGGPLGRIVEWLRARLGRGVTATDKQTAQLRRSLVGASQA